ncbi:MAG: purine-nucleoside phosphorylase [Fuerstiella sp.]|nr:purine-nucleoside phosphorylase [Fuerstiella sp.]MCP4858290.1 purine-nucleoside phosphorylase [Fuerstiella sp.]
MPHSGEAAVFQSAVILGSGLGAAGEMALNLGGIAIDFDQIPHLPCPAVRGHAGRLIIGTGELAGTLLLQGRVHLYEGHSLERATFVIRVLQQLGVQNLLVTNAAGGISDAFRVGDLMLLNGHWTFLNVHQPSNQSRKGPSTKLWSERFRHVARSVDSSLVVHEGVYAMMSGPNYETPAEVQMLKTLGVDAVGMSTVPESLAAVAAGMEVLGVSCITNLACGLTDHPLNHCEVSRAAAEVETEFARWLFNVLSRLRF